MTRQGLRRMSRRAVRAGMRAGAAALALIVALTMMLPVNLAAFADDPIDAEPPASQELQESEESPDSQETQEPQEPREPQESPALQESQTSQETQESQPFEGIVPLEVTPEAGALTPLDDEMPEGEGTQDLPYLIASASQLQWMATQINTAETFATYNDKHYKLTADIDLDGVAWATMSTTSTTPFRGTFDGDGYAIKNMTISSTVPYQGFFGYANAATIKNLTLTNAIVSGGNYTGGLVGSAAGATTISNVTSTDASITGGNFSGGLVGSVAGATTVSNVTFTNPNIKVGTYSGGLVGYATAAITVSNVTFTDASIAGGATYSAAGLVGYTTGAVTASKVAFTDASITGGSYAAGLVGYASNAVTMSDCFVTGTVTGTQYPAGLVSFTQSAATIIRDCYVNVDVTSTNTVAGGILGNASNGTVTNCYALGTVIGATAAGGILGNGSNTVKVTNCFALNSTVAVTAGTAALPGAIAGSISGMYTLSENYAFDGIKLKNANTTEDESLIIVGATNDRFGGYVSKAALLSAATWTNNGFSTTAWTIESGKAPILSAFAGNPSVAQTTSFGSFIDNTLTLPALTDANKWYYEGDKYKTATEFTISTADELAVLAQLVNSGSDSFFGRTIKLANDIDLEAYCTAQKAAAGGWTPIGTTTAQFKGIFDGNGKAISHLSILTEANYLALFGSINGTTIKDLALTDLSVVNSAAGQYVAGLAAQATGAASSISGCYVSGHVESGGNPVAGILAAASSGEIAISDCLVAGTIQGTSSVAGIVGSANGSPTIKNCIVMASLVGATTATNGDVAGILGWTNGSQNVTIEGCRVLSENISSSAPGAIYSFATGSSPVKVTDAIAWKGLKLNGTTLMDVLYDNPAGFNSAKNGTILSWKLATQDAWSEGFTNSGGAWTYTVGKLPTLKKFATILSNAFPDYMSDSLVKPAPADGAALASAIEEADKLQGADYPDGWDDFSLSLLRAKLILNDDESSQAEINTEKQLLEDALKLLEERAALVFQGSGTEGNPYLVSNVAELHKVKRVVNATGNENVYRDKHYKLTADINMEGEYWTPIGTSSSAVFAGVFDGNDKTISNLTVQGSSYVALFGYINGATIKDLTLKDVEVEGTGSNVAGLVGFIAGSLGDSTISECKVSGHISGANSVGGIVGTAQLQAANATVTIEACSVSAGITGNGISNSAVNVGGIVGYMASAATKVVIRNSDVILSDEENISAIGYNIGGLVGISSNNTTVDACSVTGGSVKGEMYTGGLIGSTAYNTGVTLSDCFVQTAVESSASNAGGLVGYLYGTNGNVIATSCAFKGTVKGTEYVGGLLGNGSYYALTDCFVGGAITGTNYVGGFLGGTSATGGANGKIASSYTTASVYGDTNVGGFVGRQTSNGPLSIIDCRSLGEAVGYPALGMAKTVGALTGDAQYGTANFVQTNALSWKGLKLDKKTLTETSPGDALYNMNRNGIAFLDWSLRFSEGWPSSLTEGTGAWSYTEGKLPVLKSLADKMESEFPAYMADIPASGEPGDRTELIKAIAATEALERTDYVEESAMWSEVQSVLTYARVIHDFYDASQADIDTAEERLLTAVAELNRLNNITLDGGDGTVDAPYEIANLDQLLKMNRLVNSPDTTVKNQYRALHYKLTADIDLGEDLWLPLGTTSYALTGGFDGGGNTISNMTVVGELDQAFIGYTSGAVTIKNLTLKDVSVSGQTRVAGLVGYAAGAATGGAETGLTIENCHVSGTINSIYNNTGGLVGYTYNGTTIKNCTASVDIVVRQSYVGGIAGQMAYGLIENCSVKNYTENGSIIHNGNDYVGGIVGSVDAGNAYTATIKNCSVTANLLGTYVGGIIGYGTSGGTEADHLVVSGCYFDGMISPASASASAILGGIASTLQNNFRITDCASNGTIIMASAAGGILARFNGTLATDVTITDCYTTMRIGNSVSAGGIVGAISSTSGTGKLIISDSLALNEQVGGSDNANAIHAIGEENAKFDYTLSGVKAWDGMLIVIGGEQQASPDGDSAISYEDLLLAASWSGGFKSAPWTYAAGKLPVLTGINSMSSSFPEFMTSSEGPQIIADYAQLHTAIDTADALSQVAYTVASWATLSEALGTAKTVLYSGKATQSEVDAAATALLEAIEGLDYYREDTTLEGDGSEASPYLIGSVADYDEMTRLMNIAGTDLYLTAYYELTADIDLSGSLRSPLPYSEATGTNGALAFSGDFNGNGFTISNLGVRHTYYTGMFGIVKGAYIHDLNLTDVDILGYNYNTGAIAGNINDTVLENITVSGYVRGSSSTGGIVGVGNSSVMRNCHFNGTAEIAAGGFGYNLGGLAGQFGALIEDCSVTGKVVYSGTQQSGVYMGGAVGVGGGSIIRCRVEADILYTCYNDGIVRAGDCVGGVAGQFGGSLIDCYYKGTIEVRGANNGGIVGELRGGLIQGCVSEGLLDMNWWNDTLSPRPTGGIVGLIRTDDIYTGPSSVIIDDCETSMTIDGFQQAGGIAGTATGTGTLTITNTRAMNSVIFNTNNNYYVNPFFFGESSFAGTYISEDNYIWEGMVINGKTLDEWIRQTYNEERYTEENGYEKIPVSSNPPGGGESSNPSNPPNPSNVSPGIVTGDGSSITGVGVSTEVASGTAIDNRPASAQSGQSQNTNTPNVDTPITEPTTPEAAEPTPARTPTFFEIVVETVQNNPLVVVALIVAAGVLAMLGGLWRYRKTRRE